MHYFRYLGSKEQARQLWENREALDKYLQRLKELMEEKPGTGNRTSLIMGDFRIIINAVGGHGQDREKKHGDVVDFGANTPEAIAKECVEKLKASGVNVEDASVIHWPVDNYGGQLKNERSTQIVDDLVTGKRTGSF